MSQNKPWDEKWEFSDECVGYEVRLASDRETNICRDVMPDDGRFIAAAPDLYRALEAVLQAAEANREAWGGLGLNLGMVRCALMKARGE